MGVLKVKTAPGVWTPVTQGFDPYHQQLSAVSAGGTINAGASGTVVTLTTPAIPAGRFLLVTMSVHVRQTTASAFDINMTWPAGIGIVAHQFGAGVNATGQLVSMTRVVPTTGAAQTFRIDVNAWGAQAVLYGAQSNIAITVMPLATAGLGDATPRGYIGLGVQSLNQSGLGVVETDITGMTVTWTADPTRRYKTTASAVLRQGGTAGEQFLHVTNAANGHVKSSAFGAVGAGGVATHVVVVSETGLSGAQTRKGRVSVTPGTASTNAAEYVGYVLVEDIGGV